MQAQAPGDVVQIDVKHLNIAGATYYQFTAIDKYSRFCFARVYESKNSWCCRKIDKDNRRGVMVDRGIRLHIRGDE